MAGRRAQDAQAEGRGLTRWLDVWPPGPARAAGGGTEPWNGFRDCAALQPAGGDSGGDDAAGHQADLALEPDVVVIQYVGNNAAECVSGPDGEPLMGRALVERFEADVRAATELFATNGARVVLVGGPHAPGLPGKASLGIADAYNRIVNDWAGFDLGRVRYADAAATVTDDHVYERRLPCRDDEGPDEGCVDGEVTVRHLDRIHFCPTDYNELVCPVPSPGAVRFGEEMARVAPAQYLWIHRRFKRQPDGTDVYAS